MSHKGRPLERVMSGRWQGSNRAARLPADWNRRRQHVLERDSHRCTWIDDDKRCEKPATDVDHIQSGDDHSYDNLRSLCGPHHDRKTAAEGIAARHRFSRRRPSEQHPGVVEGGG